MVDRPSGPVPHHVVVEITGNHNLAMVIGMAGAATLLVLPSLLTLVTRADGANEPVEATSASGTPSHLTPTS